MRGRFEQIGRRLRGLFVDFFRVLQTMSGWVGGSTDGCVRRICLMGGR